MISFSPLVVQFATEVKSAASIRLPFAAPEIGHHWLAGRQPFQSMRWNGEGPGSDIFAKGEERVVPLADSCAVALLPLSTLICSTPGSLST